MPSKPLLILGASARAAAWSASGPGGVEPWCIDLFADTDLERNATALALDAALYPRGLVKAARQAPPGPWLYTGALENHPRVIEAIARERPLWGNAAEVVREVRCPARVADVLRTAGLPCPAVADGCLPDPDKAWLVKPRASAGGASIRAWRGRAIPRSSYAQEWIEGEPCSALFVGQRDSTAKFLGATRQLIGLPWLHANDFRYCGTVGPLNIAAATRARLQELGNVLAEAFCLRGFFGVDFILKDDVPWPVEVNPRYTAAIEVLERARGARLFSEHAKVFAALPQAVNATELPGFWCKAILFAQAPLLFPADGPWQKSLHHSWTDAAGPDYADIPHPGSRMDMGQPIMTLFAHAATAARCLESLRDMAQALDRGLFG